MPQYGLAETCAYCGKTIWSDQKRLALPDHNDAPAWYHVRCGKRREREAAKVAQYRASIAEAERAGFYRSVLEEDDA